MKVLVTGSAGFIGYHLTNALLQADWEVLGLDNINEYYDSNLKFSRLEETGIKRDAIVWNKTTQSQKFGNYRFVRQDIEDKISLLQLFKDEKFDYVIHLAAQAGVRYSIDNPDVYIQSNLIGFYNIIESCRIYPVKYLLYASSSSVYGNNIEVPFKETDNVDRPISLYAATKKCNELMAYTYGHLYNIKATGLRFFTVYGPWGRPDMAIFKFTKAITERAPLEIYNSGNLYRDFTYIDDITNGIIKLLEKRESSDKKLIPLILNIGNNKPVKLMDFIFELEKNLNAKALGIMKPMQKGDVIKTHAEIKAIQEYIAFTPSTSLSIGIKKFVDWYLAYYKIR